MSLKSLSLLVENILRRTSIRFRLIANVFISGALFIGLSLLIISQYVTTAEQRTKESMEYFSLRIAVPVVEDALWRGNTGSISEILTNLVDEGPLVSVTVEDINGNTFFSHSKAHEGIETYKINKDLTRKVPIESSSGIDIDYNVVEYDEMPLGKLSLVVNNTIARTSFIKSIVSNTPIMIIAIIILIGFTYMVSLSVTRPLKNLMVSIENKKFRDPSIQESLLQNNDDELSILFEKLWDYQKTLSEKQSELKVSNDTLQSHYSKLQQEMENTRLAKTELARANDRKDQFISNVSHELLTPLSAIVAGVDFISGDIDKLWERINTLPPTLEIKKSLRTTTKYLDNLSTSAHIINESTTKMSILVEDILSSISDHVEGDISLSKVALQASLNEVIDSRQPIIEDKGLTLFTNIEIDPDLIVTTDWDRIRQSIGAVLSNAVNFTSKGSVSVDATAEQKGSVVYLTITITDTGCGIKKSDSEVIFERFHISEDVSTKSYAGVGVGLSNARTLAESLGGTVNLRYSHLSKGSSFRLDFPLNLAETTSSPLISNIPRKINLLYVEDSKVNRHIFERYCSSRNIELTLASQAKEALNMDLTQFDAVVSDCHMPFMSGQEMAKAIRKMELPSNTRIPIIALTADQSASNRNLCFSSGFNAFYTKPYNQKTFNSIVDFVLEYTTTLLEETPFLNNDTGFLEKTE